MKTKLLLSFILFTAFILNAQVETVPTTKNADSIQKNEAPVFLVVQSMPIFDYVTKGVTIEGDSQVKKEGSAEIVDYNRLSKVNFACYIKDKLRVRTNVCYGKMVVQFIVEPDGSLSSVNVVRKIPNCESVENDLIQIIQTMPKWIPGKQNGIGVRVKQTMPIEIIKE